MYLTLCKRELSLHVAGLGEWFAVPALYLLLISFYVVGQPFGEVIVASGAAAVLWMAALLAMGLTQHRIWEDDARDGTLEQWMLLPVPLEGVVAVKLLAHWVMSGLPLVVLTPVLLLLLGLELPAALPLLVGSVAFTFLGAVAGVLGLYGSSRQLLTMLIVFPLSVPLLIFGAAASLPEGGSSLELLLAYALAICPVSVFLCAALLRMQVRG